MVISRLGRSWRLDFNLQLYALMLFSAQGCQFAPKQSTATWPWQKDVAKALPERIVPVWTDSVLHQPSQPGVRGFGGRVYFYGKEKTDPIEVDGSFAVYVFDAEDNALSDQKPRRKFVFTADQFKTHMSKTSMGPSYSVWIPWGEVGGEPRRLSLISRFEGRDGGTTISDPTIKMLPGIPTNKESASAPGSSPVSLATHSESVREPAKKDKQDGEIAVGSIDLPPAFQRHLRSPSASFDIMKGVDRSPATSQPLPQEVPSQLNNVNSSKEPDVAPITTQVIDSRSRGSQRLFSENRLKQSKRNIHDGRWIQSISRAEKKE